MASAGTGGRKKSARKKAAGKAGARTAGAGKQASRRGAQPRKGAGRRETAGARAAPAGGRKGGSAGPARAKRPRKAAGAAATKRTGGRREENKVATRGRIVDAALELFERNGFQETTTKAIAKRAGIAEGTVFNYFPTKEDIALHFFELEVDHAIATVRSSRRLRGAPLEEKLFALVQSQMEYLAPYERFIGAAFVQALRPMSAFVVSPRSWALRARYLAFVQELIDEEIPRRSVTMVSWLAPQAFWVFYVALLLYWLNDTSPGKESTLAFLDRSLRIGVTVLRGEMP